MIKEKAVCIAMLVLALAVNTFGGLITFDLFGDPAMYDQLDNQPSGSITNGGLIATLSLTNGVLNRTTSGFGVNHTESGDDTDGLNADEYIDIVFSQVVIFNNLNVSSWGASDAGEVQLGTTNKFTAGKNISGTGDNTFNIEVRTNQTIRILATADSGATNGFSVNRFTVSIPEPAVTAFIALTGLGMLIGRRFMR